MTTAFQIAFFVVGLLLLVPPEKVAAAAAKNDPKPKARISSRSEEVLYNRDIRPILSDQCYACHGPGEKKRKAKIRLDLKEEAFKEAKSGGFAIVPGDLDKSLLLKRITDKDPETIMPPLETGKKMTEGQIDLLRRWIAQGAKWQEHW